MNNPTYLNKTGRIISTFKKESIYGQCNDKG